MKILDHNSTQYNRILLIGDLKSETTKKHIVNFCDIFNLKMWLKNQLVLKIPKNPLFFIYTHFLETGLSSFHNINVTKMSQKCLIQNNEIALYFIGAIRRLTARNFGQRTI